MPGVPIVFYGSEIALNGNLAPDNHKLMNFKTEQELVEYITKLSDLRDMHPALTKGDMEILYEQGEPRYSNVYMARRRWLSS